MTGRKRRIQRGKSAERKLLSFSTINALERKAKAADKSVHSTRFRPNVICIRAEADMPNLKPTLLGIPFDANSSYLRGAADAPPLIREAFRCDSSNSSTESGIELGAESVLDAGDLELPADGAFTAIESAVRGLLDKGQAPVCLGGDHSITYPILRAFGKRFADLTIVHFDAHPDLYDEFQGNRCSHACPFARIMEEGCVKRLIQVGIRTMNAHQREQADRFGVEVVEMQDLNSKSICLLSLVRIHSPNAKLDQPL